MKMAKAKKNNSKIYWILGGLGALILFGGFLILTLGAGIFLYALNSESEDKKLVITTGEQKPKEKNGDKIAIKVEDSTVTNKTKAMNFARFIKEKHPTVGKFKLLEAKPFESKLFSQSAYMVIGNYKEPGVSTIVSHWYASYDDWDTAKDESTKRIKELEEVDPKMKPIIKEDSVMAVFVKQGRMARLNCWNIKEKGTCELVARSNSKQLIRYLKVYYDR